MWQFANPQTSAPARPGLPETPENQLTESQGLDLYPNPAKGHEINLYIPEMKEEERAELNIIDSHGKVSHRESVTRFYTVEHNLHPGLYIVKVQTASRQMMKKIIVE
jgi:hypothetical protein